MIFFKSSKVLLLALMLHVGLKANAQVEPPKIIPPSPNAAALGKFIESPTGLYTGIPSIHVPVWTVKEGAIEVPISLSYHAGGVKVAEIASNTGLGWALGAGGMITRSVLGLADEAAWGYLNVSQDVEMDYERFKLYATNNLDGQPDMFYCSMNGRSFRFVFDEEGNIHTIPRQNVVIEKGPVRRVTVAAIPMDAIVRWTITDEAGTIYKFNVYEPSATRTLLAGLAESNPNPSVNTWHLTEIISAGGDHVYFQYQDESYVSDVLMGVDKYIVTNASFGCTWESPGQTVLRQYITTKRLSDIVFSNGRIRFIPHQNTRADVIDASALEKIVVENTEGEVERQFWLTHGYLIGHDILAYNDVQPGANENNRITAFFTNFPASFNRRLLLTGIKEKDRNGTDVNQGHSFEYHHEIGLPNRAFGLMDHWGYANTIETYNAQPAYALVSGNYAWLGKTPSYHYAKEVTLNKVVYPTGGYATYAYELNKVQPSPLTPLPYEFIPGPSLSISHASAYEDRLDIAHEDRADDTGHVMKSHYLEFQVNSPNGHVETDIVLENLPNLPVSGILSFSVKKVLASNPLQENSIWTGWENGPHGLYLENGTYRLYHNPAWAIWSDPGSQYYYSLYNAHITGWYQLASPPPGESGRPAGGLRIKEFKLYSSATADPLTYQYEYLDPDNSTSGNLVSAPNYNRPYSTSGSESSSSYQECHFQVLGSESNIPLGTTQGSYVGYGFVSERQIDKNGHPLGKTKYEYTFSPDYDDFSNGTEGIPGSKFPFPPNDNRDWMRGQLLRASTYSYNAASGTYEMVREEKNEYNFKSLGQVSRARKVGITDFDLTSQGMHSTLGVVYYVYSGYFLKTRTTVSERGVYEDRTDLTYSPESLLPTHTTTHNSDGSKDHIFTTFPFEYAPGTAFIDSLKKFNIVNAEIERVNVQEDALGNFSITGGILKKYNPDRKGNIAELYGLEISTPVAKSQFKFSSRGLGLLPPDGTMTQFDADMRYVKRITYDRYDGNRLLQYTQNGTETTSFIWGYNKMFPVSEIKNANYATIESILGTGFNLGAGGLTTTQQTLLRSSTSLNNSNITTYTYIPLRGMSSVTDANNKTTYQEYDSFGRLRLIKDHNGKILKIFSYHYKQ